MKKLDRRPQILVVGYGADVCTPQAYELAYRVGRRIAERGAILITGGLGGIMEAASKGCQEAGGISVGIIPFEDKTKANPYLTVVIPTGIGYARNFITGYSGDSVVVVGGGSGSLTEMAAAYMRGIPIIAVVESGGVAREFAGRSLDERNLVVVEAGNGPEESVDRALRAATLRRRVAKGSPRGKR